MNGRLHFLLSLVFLGLTAPTVYAIAIDIPPGQWQCMAVDKKQQNYAAFGKSQLAARHAAKVECRKRSELPRTCQTAQSFCEQGPIAINTNRCVVSDQSGRTWNTDGPNACRTAMYLCQQWQYLHGSTRSACNVRHRMRDYDRNGPKENTDTAILDKLLDVE